MDLRYRYAVVSYCSDLRDPAGFSTPVGVVIIGKTEGAAIGAAISPNKPPPVDPFAQGVVRNMLRILKDQIDDAAKKLVSEEDTDAVAQQIMRTLQHSMRNTLFVSEVSSECVATFDKPEELSAVISRELHMQLRAAFQRALETLQAQFGEMIESKETRYLLDPGPDFFGPFSAWPLFPQRTEALRSQA